MFEIQRTKCEEIKSELGAKSQSNFLWNRFLKIKWSLEFLESD